MLHPTITEESSHRHLATILEAYLKGDSSVTEERLLWEVEKYHSPDELRWILRSTSYAYLLEIDPYKLEQVKKKFLQ